MTGISMARKVRKETLLNAYQSWPNQSGQIDELFHRRETVERRTRLLLRSGRGRGLGGGRGI